MSAGSTDGIATVHKNAEEFLRRLQTENWISDTGIDQRDNKSAADLFDSNVASRPLVVGLFGGTGVGKSSLLNRLAGSAVANTGVVRPTSLEITAYLHESRDINALPENFSVSNFQTIKHHNVTYQDVMWVDMPDFDSDETQNRDQVLQWIPHIDLLIYVVTPERYKDEQGWRLLMSEGYRHAWLFVINQWDKAEESQLDDFVRLLEHTGFAHPRVFRTVGIDAQSDVDDFDSLAALVAGLAERNAVEQLEQVGWFRRLERVRAKLMEYQPLLEPTNELVALFNRHWTAACQSVEANLQLPVKQYADNFTDARQSSLKNALQSMSAGKDETAALAARSLTQDAPALWDQWSQVKLSDAITEFELAQSEHGLPARRLTAMRSAIGSLALEKIGQTWAQRVAAAVAAPGPHWQRLLQKGLSMLSMVLPIAAILWITYRIVSGFVDGAGDPAAYLGTGFLTNSLLMVGVAWLLPWLASHFSRPSVPRAVARVLFEQLDKDLELPAARYRDSLAALSEQRAELHQQASTLQKDIDAALSRSSVLTGEDVRELLMQTPSTQTG